MRAIIPNLALGIAYAIASAFGCKYRIQINEHDLDVKFDNPVSTENRVWEDHFGNAAIYIADSANPIDIDTDEKHENPNIVASDYYASAMKMNVMEGVFNAEGSMHDTIKMLLYANLGGLAVVAFLIVAV